MSCGEGSKGHAEENILVTDPEIVAALNDRSIPSNAQMLAAAKAFVANHHESSAIINKFIDESAIKNGVLPTDCEIAKEDARCPNPNVDIHYRSPGTDFNLSIAVSPDGFGGPAHDAIQDNLSQGPGQ